MQFTSAHILMLCILVVVVFWSTCASCSRFSIVDVVKKLLNQGEGFETIGGVDTTDYSDSLFKINTAPVDPASWANMHQKGKMNVDKHANLLFANTPFKPECCPSTYSNSSGCACISDKQYDYLGKRGGNNVPYSEY